MAVSYLGGSQYGGQSVWDDPFKPKATPTPYPARPAAMPVPTPTPFSLVKPAYAAEPQATIGGGQSFAPGTTAGDSTLSWALSGGKNLGGGGDTNALIDKMVQSGHTQESAQAAIQGQGYEALAQEYGLLEQVPEAPQIDWDALYAPAFEAYNQLEQTIRESLPVTEQEIRGEAARTKTGLQTELSSRLGELEQQKAEAQRQTQQVIGESKTATESAIAEARRQQAQIQQAIQARYGGTTGTGRFASEVLGAEAMRNIGKYRTSLQQNIAKNTAALQNTLGKVDLAINNLKTEVTSKIADIDSRTQELIARARQSLNERLAEINLKKGELESQKAAQRQDVLQRYRQEVNDIQARNTAFKQQLFRDAQAFANEMQMLKERAREKYTVANQGLTLPELGLAAQRFGLGISPESFASLAELGGPIGAEALKGVQFTERDKEKEQEEGLPELF